RGAAEHRLRAGDRAGLGLAALARRRRPGADRSRPRGLSRDADPRADVHRSPPAGRGTAADPRRGVERVRGGRGHRAHRRVGLRLPRRDPCDLRGAAWRPPRPDARRPRRERPPGAVSAASDRGPLAVGIDAHSAEVDGEGNSTYSRNLIAALLQTRGAEAFTLFGANTAHPFYRSLPARGGTRTVGVAQGAGLLRVAVTLGRAAVRARVDCLHVQYAAPLALGRPVVVSVHDLGFLHLPESFPAALRLALRVLVPRSVARAARVITCSEHGRRDIEA